MTRDTERPDAPSGPTDVGPTWTSSAKDLVVTALGPGRVWATLGYGILNEVYWPSTGNPQIRDLGFIVQGPAGWTEVKRANRYTLSTPAPDIPLPTVVHDGGPDWRLTLEVVPDPSRDCLLIRYALEGEGCRLYALLAPRLGPTGTMNTAWAGSELVANGGPLWLCLAGDGGFTRSSAGHVGTSDGWQDFHRNGAMTWDWGKAGPGNVAVMGELAAGSGTLALAFAASREGAVTLARSSLADGMDAIRAEAIRGWSDWAARVRPLSWGNLDPGLLDQGRRSAAVLKTHEDRSFPGAIVASLSVPWGNSRDDLGGYHLVWPRDAVNTGLGLLASGQTEDACRMLAYLTATQQDDGRWAQNFYPDGRAYWSGVQLDEVAFPVLLAAKLQDAGALSADPGVRARVARMVRRAVGYIVRNGPVTPQDRWEENAGLSPYTLAVVVCALVAGSDWLSGPEREAALALADDWNTRIEDWTFAEGGTLARAASVPGHYVRIAPRATAPLAEQLLPIQNRGGLQVPATEVVAMDFLALCRFGLRSPHDPRIRDTLRVCEGVLGIDTPFGRTYRRYNEDGYGEHDDGSPFDGTGRGRGWPLLTGERGHYALQSGEDPQPWLGTMAAMTGPGGLIPEQVWDGPPIPGRPLAPGRPTGGAMPLVWAHSEFLRLVAATMTGRPVEILDSVLARYGQMPPRSHLRSWRPETPARTVPVGAALRIEDTAPFLLHFSFDDWRTAFDRQAEPGAFGLHGLTIHSEPGREIVFTRQGPDGWDGVDHRVRFL
ncbi:glycoside hydrolase family 15 protein [Rubellimicrobium arenae]|uniref:glycoside hydrolase family 15 protein n=1 Tax=Rubellimicrobium arenae TaxID=2817372 RepID=UPI001B30334B|nr:glycoside hydrolase family 15 protein [Rubellimicrobium arenae]